MRASTPEQEAPLQPAFLAIAVGDFAGAGAALDEAVSAAPELAAAHELLGGICFGALADYARARRHLGLAYRLYRAGGDLRAATRAAITLAQIDLTTGDGPGSRGWLGRARRLIDEIGPCVEEGYYRIAVMGCDVPDVTQLEADAARALELARRFGDADLEVRALAETGLALVSVGRTIEGRERLDEALTAVIAGEVQDLMTCGLTC